MYAQFQLLWPQAQENTSLACMGKPADTLAVLLPLTAERLERARTCQPSHIKHGIHVDGVNSLVKLLSWKKSFTRNIFYKVYAIKKSANEIFVRKNLFNNATWGNNICNKRKFSSYTFSAAYKINYGKLCFPRIGHYLHTAGKYTCRL